MKVFHSLFVAEIMTLFLAIIINIYFIWEEQHWYNVFTYVDSLTQLHA